MFSLKVPIEVHIADSVDTVTSLSEKAPASSIEIDDEVTGCATWSTVRDCERPDVRRESRDKGDKECR